MLSQDGFLQCSALHLRWCLCDLQVLFLNLRGALLQKCTTQRLVSGPLWHPCHLVEVAMVCLCWTDNGFGGAFATMFTAIPFSLLIWRKISGRKMSTHGCSASWMVYKCAICLFQNIYWTRSDAATNDILTSKPNKNFVTDYLIKNKENLTSFTTKAIGLMA